MLALLVWLPGVKNKLRIVEIYAGTGRSLDPFRTWRRAEIALLVDANPIARDVYLQNHPGARYLVRDLRFVNPDVLATWAGGKFDVLMGCPPCQGFSESGLRQENDPRNRHVLKFTAFALAAKPRAVVMENVPAAAASSEFAFMIAELERSGYRWTGMIANAAQYGSSQSRQRLLFVAVRKDRGDAPVFPSPTHGSGRTFSYSLGEMRPAKENLVEMLGLSPITQHQAEKLPQNFTKALGAKRLRTVCDDIGNLPCVSSPEAQLWDHIPWKHSTAVLRRMGQIREGGRWSGGADHFAHTYGRLHRDGLARTLTASFGYAGGGRYWHPVENRALTLREAARIQGFPDEFTFGTRGKMGAVLAGNALDAQLSRVCYETVRASVD